MYLWVHVTYTPLFLRNSDVLRQFKFIAIIHQVNNVRSSQRKHSNSLQWAHQFSLIYEPGGT